MKRADAHSYLLKTLVVATALAVAACEPPEPTTFEELAQSRLPQIEGTIDVPGLQANVEVIRDPWGVPHIYADNMDDVFFAQGFVQAQDRLWQMDMYRRAAEGRLSEIFGPDMIESDRAARLFKFRGPWTDAEFNSYHPEGRRILEAFAAGVNAYIAHAEAEGELPVEYTLTGLAPEPWRPESSLLRTETAMPLGDARNELSLAQQVAELGAAAANRAANPTPYRDLVVPRGVDYSIITPAVADGTRGFQGTRVEPPLVAPYDTWAGATASIELGVNEDSPGSNNWAVSGSRTASGRVIVANDPHRNVSNPSLRYIVHLDAPGWTVIGATEPVLPGVSIGHNGRVGWGLTILGTDQSDVYVETVNPENPNEVMYNGAWEPLRIEYDTVQVKGAAPEIIELKFSRHGPIFFEDAANRRAYAIRSTMNEPGTTGYLAGLRLDQVDTCVEFLEEIMYWKAPTENMVCGDAEGNIAWHGSALTPARNGWHGRLPVPGTGQYEWTGFRQDLPFVLNPEAGYIATANNDTHINVPGYDPPLFFKTAGTFDRFDRLSEVFPNLSDVTVEDVKALQHDAFNAAALRAMEHFKGWTSQNPELETYRGELAEWDGVQRREQRAPAIYGELRSLLPGGGRGAPPAGAPFDAEAGLATAIERLRQEQGPDPATWNWGRTNRSEFPHTLVSAYDLPAAERMGGQGTVAAVGATYREIIDFSNIDGSVGTNTPGQSARPGSPFYGNLIENHRNAEYFPLSFSREAVEANAAHRLLLRASTE
jgi:penicillin amidase